MEITSSQLMAPVKLPKVTKTMALGLAVLWGLALLLAFAGSAAFLFQALWVTVLLVVGSLLWRSSRYYSNALQHSERVFRQFVGKEVRYLDVTVGWDSNEHAVGTGMAYDRGVLYAMDRGLAARIPIEAVRGCEYKLTSYLAKHPTAAARIRAQMVSGLFVQIASVDKPVWQFMSADKDLLDRWQEIIRQAREGQI